jgi:hypothetical protein
MEKISSLKFHFTKSIPHDLEDGVLYISMEYATAIHLCCCGCNNQVITPLSPTDWSLSFNGVAVSLSPSIGNWSFPCQSHYWVKSNNIEWAGAWSSEKISAGRKVDHYQKTKHESIELKNKPNTSKLGFINKLRKWLNNI